MTDMNPTLQEQIHSWMIACFGEVITADITERNHRFLEEALELVQSTGCTASEAYQLVDYVFGRPVGDPPQEVGGVMVTLGALCNASAIDMDDAGRLELARVWGIIENVRAKQSAKPKYSPLPIAQHPDDIAVDRFAEALKAKMKISREQKGRGGWEKCPIEQLWSMLDSHVQKGNPVDVGNFAMMIWNLNQPRIQHVTDYYSDAIVQAEQDGLLP
eukprot:gene33112-42546_t